LKISGHWQSAVAVGSSINSGSKEVDLVKKTPPIGNDSIKKQLSSKANCQLPLSIANCQLLTETENAPIILKCR
jgi:hypothetical protein